MKMNAKLLKANYMREYRDKNREQINKNHREWSRRNPDKIRKYQENYWNRKAEAYEMKGSET